MLLAAASASTSVCMLPPLFKLKHGFNKSSKHTAAAATQKPTISSKPLCPIRLVAWHGRIYVATQMKGFVGSRVKLARYKYKGPHSCTNLPLHAVICAKCIAVGLLRHLLLVRKQPSAADKFCPASTLGCEV